MNDKIAKLIWDALISKLEPFPSKDLQKVTDELKKISLDLFTSLKENQPLP